MTPTRLTDVDRLHNPYESQRVNEQESQWDAIDAVDRNTEHRLRHRLKWELAAMTLLGLICAAGVLFFDASRSKARVSPSRPASAVG